MQMWKYFFSIRAVTAVNMPKRTVSLAAEEPAASVPPPQRPRLEARQYHRPAKVNDERLEVLLQRQEKHCPLILEELRKNGRKTSHWAWWVFPTEKEGFSEPSPTTCVTPNTAEELLERAPDTWRLCLEEIAALATSRCTQCNDTPGADSSSSEKGSDETTKETTYVTTDEIVKERSERSDKKRSTSKKVGIAAVLPAIDLPRVKYFVKFWRDQPATPPWLLEVCSSLEAS